VELVNATTVSQALRLGLIRSPKKSEGSNEGPDN